ncbi:MAG TPA: hypothetical protein VGB94_12310 [Acidobacteriaceae bacterium]
MLNGDQYMERTPDLVTRIRAMREAAEKEMNRFTRVADYDVRRVIGQKPKASPVPVETAPPSPASMRQKRSAKSATAQTSIEFALAPVEHGDGEENA